MDDSREAIQSEIDRFLAATKLDLVTTDIREADGGFVVEIGGADRDLLIERNGELLGAFQLVLQKMIRLEGRSEPVPVVLDTQGYRAARDGELREIAILAAQKVKRDGKVMTLSPMSPYERRVVHLALCDDGEVFTQSEGDGFLKSVGIYPREDGA